MAFGSGTNLGNLTLNSIRTTDPLIALSGSTEHGPQPGLGGHTGRLHPYTHPTPDHPPPPHFPLPAPSLAEAAKDIGRASVAQTEHATWISGFITTWVSNMDPVHQRGLQWHQGLWWTFKELESRKSTILQLGPPLLPRARAIQQQGGMLRG